MASKAMIVVFLWAVSCTGAGAGDNLVPPGRVPVAVGDAGASADGQLVDLGAAEARPADGQLVDLGAPPGPDAAPPSSPDGQPPAPDAGEVEYPPCGPDVEPRGLRCSGGDPGVCRLQDDRVCYECEGTAVACSWRRNITRPAGPRCDEPRICLPPGQACPVLDGPACLRPDAGG